MTTSSKDVTLKAGLWSKAVPVYDYTSKSYVWNIRNTKSSWHLCKPTLTTVTQTWFFIPTCLLYWHTILLKRDITPESFTKGDFKSLHLLWFSTSIIKSHKWKYGYFYWCWIPGCKNLNFSYDNLVSIKVQNQKDYQINALLPKQTKLI